MRIAILAVLIALAPAAGRCEPVHRPFEMAARDPNPPEQQTPEVSSLLRTILQAIQDWQNGDQDSAHKAFERATKSREFPSLPPEIQRVVYENLADLEISAGDYTQGRDYATRATETEGASGLDWQLRFAAEDAAGDSAAAAISLTKLAEGWPQALSNLSDSSVLQLMLQTPHGDAQYKLMRAIYAARWRPKNPFLDSSNAWVRLAAYLLDDGQTEAAREVAQSVTSPAGLILTHADRRFDAVVAADPSRYDVPAGLDREMAALRSASAAAPDKLEGVNRVAAALLLRNQAAQALDLLNGAIEKAHPPPGGKSAFSDADEQLRWALNYQQEALWNLGRADDALGALQKAAARPEYGRVNVSQALNLAAAYNAASRPRDTLAALADVGTEVSPYGMMVLHKDEACAYFQLNDRSKLGDALQYLRDHAKVGPLVVINAVAYCSDDEEDLARILIERLEDKATREEVLVTLQHYLPAPHPSVLDAAGDLRVKAALARPDVKTELDRVGRIETYAIYEPRL